MGDHSYCSPKSLAVLPVLYFYTESARYVRSLLYGWLHWLLSGSDTDILNRKRVFSIHRAIFEQILLENKNDITTGITRKTGSGPEVTNQTAQYYQGLLELLVEHKDDIQSEVFNRGYMSLTRRLTNKPSRVKVSRGISRAFTTNQRSTIVLANLFSNPNRCGICGGMLDPAADLQHDHILEFSKGGRTTIDNQRLTHPFCNNNREIIEAGRNGKESIKLPAFVDPALSTEPIQLTLRFFDDPLFT
jgi:HNH endonuclease